MVKVNTYHQINNIYIKVIIKMVNHMVMAQKYEIININIKEWNRKKKRRVIKRNYYNL